MERNLECEKNKEELPKILAIIPSSFCFGLQNLTLSFFGELKGKVNAYFLNTAWNDGEFPRRLDKMGFPHLETWLGMFSRKLDPRNVKMTLHALLKLPLAWYDFIKVYRRFRPDVVYLANHHEVILLLPLLFFVRHKVVVHMHDPPPAIPFQKLSFSIWRKVVHKFIFISESVKCRTAMLGALREHDKVVYNGITVSPLNFPRVRSSYFVDLNGWPSDSIVVGITGQMTRTKGHEDFIAAAAMAAKINPNLYFVIGGRPIEPFHTELKERIKELGLESRIRFAGWMPSVKDFFDALDVFVMASRHDEGFGLVVAEAMERGCVVISTKSGGAIEIVEDNVSGFLVNKSAPNELAKAIIYAFSTKFTQGKNSSELGRLRVTENFNITKQANLFIEILKK